MRAEAAPSSKQGCRPHDKINGLHKHPFSQDATREKAPLKSVREAHQLIPEKFLKINPFPSSHLIIARWTRITPFCLQNRCDF